MPMYTPSGGSARVSLRPTARAHRPLKCEGPGLSETPPSLVSAQSQDARQPSSRKTSERHKTLRLPMRELHARAVRCVRERGLLTRAVGSCRSSAGSPLCNNGLLPRGVSHSRLPAGTLLWLDPLRHGPHVRRLQDEPQGECLLGAPCCLTNSADKCGEVLHHGMCYHELTHLPGK